MQRGDVAFGEAEFLQDGVGVFAGLGRAGREPRRRARQRHRLANEPHLALVLFGDVLGDAEVLDLGVGEHLVDRIDWPAWHAGLVEAIDPIGAGALADIGFDLGIKRIAMLASAVSQKRSQIFCPVAAMLM